MNKKLQQAIEIPELHRNIRGQVRVALNCLPLKTQKLLACDFAEHGLKILLENEIERMNAALQGIEEIRNFLKGKSTLQNVQDAIEYARMLGTVEIPSPTDGTLITSGKSGNILFRLKNCCCQREFEATGKIMHHKHQPDAFRIAEDACFAMSHYFMGSDLNSPDPVKKKEAKKRSRQMIEQEAIWQRNHILHYVCEGLKDL